MDNEEIDYEELDKLFKKDYAYPKKEAENY